MAKTAPRVQVVCGPHAAVVDENNVLSKAQQLLAQVLPPRSSYAERRLSATVQYARTTEDRNHTKNGTRSNGNGRQSRVDVEGREEEAEEDSARTCMAALPLPGTLLQMWLERSEDGCNSISNIVEQGSNADRSVVSATKSNQKNKNRNCVSVSSPQLNGRWLTVQPVLEYVSATHGVVHILNWPQWEEVRASHYAEQAPTETLACPASAAATSTPCMSLNVVLLWFHEGQTFRIAPAELSEVEARIRMDATPASTPTRTPTTGAVMVFNALPRSPGITSPSSAPSSVPPPPLSPQQHRSPVTPPAFSISSSSSPLLTCQIGLEYPPGTLLARRVLLPLAEPPLTRQELIELIRVAAKVRKHIPLRVAYRVWPMSSSSSTSLCGSPHTPGAIPCPGTLRIGNRRISAAVGVYTPTTGAPPLRSIESDAAVVEFTRDVLTYGCAATRIVVVQSARTSIHHSSSGGVSSSSCATSYTNNSISALPLFTTVPPATTSGRIITTGLRPVAAPVARRSIGVETTGLRGDEDAVAKSQSAYEVQPISIKYSAPPPKNDNNGDEQSPRQKSENEGCETEGVVRREERETENTDVREIYPPATAAEFTGEPLPIQKSDCEEESEGKAEATAAPDAKNETLGTLRSPAALSGNGKTTLSDPPLRQRQQQQPVMLSTGAAEDSEAAQTLADSAHQGSGSGDANVKPATTADNDSVAADVAHNNSDFDDAPPFARSFGAARLLDLCCTTRRSTSFSTTAVTTETNTVLVVTQNTATNAVIAAVINTVPVTAMDADSKSMSSPLAPTRHPSHTQQPQPQQQTQRQEALSSSQNEDLVALCTIDPQRLHGQPNDVKCRELEMNTNTKNSNETHIPSSVVEVMKVVEEGKDERKSVLSHSEEQQQQAKQHEEGIKKPTVHLEDDFGETWRNPEFYGRHTRERAAQRQQEELAATLAKAAAVAPSSNNTVTAPPTTTTPAVMTTAVATSERKPRTLTQKPAWSCSAFSADDNDAPAGMAGRSQIASQQQHLLKTLLDDSATRIAVGSSLFDITRQQNVKQNSINAININNHNSNDTGAGGAEDAVAKSGAAKTEGVTPALLHVSKPPLDSTTAACTPTSAPLNCSAAQRTQATTAIATSTVGSSRALDPHSMVFVRYESNPTAVYISGPVSQAVLQQLQDVIFRRCCEHLSVDVDAPRPRFHVSPRNSSVAGGGGVKNGILGEASRANSVNRSNQEQQQKESVASEGCIARAGIDNFSKTTLSGTNNNAQHDTLSAGTWPHVEYVLPLYAYNFTLVEENALESCVAEVMAVYQGLVQLPEKDAEEWVRAVDFGQPQRLVENEGIA